MSWLIAVVSLVSAGLAGVRWLRVAQREHYIPGSVLRFAGRWWWSIPANRILGLAALAGSGLSILPGSGGLVAGWMAMALVAVGPPGLGLRGTTGALRWTGRLRRLAATAAVVPVAAGMWAGTTGLAVPAVWGAVLVPLWIDAAAFGLRPLERRLGERWVAEAAATLRRVGPRVVAITGSYGKTSTKMLVAHLLAGGRTVLASPASFNNRLGLARAINEHLTHGVEVFVAEMGTYGPGEIAEMCEWVVPEVGVITAIGPVHLERMGSEERIAAAKREILGRARVGVLNVDHPLLAAMAEEESRRIRIVTCSTEDDSADVVCRDGVVTVGGRRIGDFDPDTVHPINLACAFGVVVALGEDPRAAGERLHDLPVPAHRQVVATSDRGFVVIDDTYNSNPSGARVALERLAKAAPAGRRVLVTPGLVELGPLQAEENRRLARDAARVVTHLVVVGRTNRSSLLAGAADAGLASVIVVEDRGGAVAWVRRHLGPGDAVLYENDLPDHYP